MGQQQLLLIVLGVVLVGIAIIVGINLFAASASQSNRDAVTADLFNLAAKARIHYNKPAALGGGGSFVNFNIPTALLQNSNGTFEHTDTGHKKDHIHFTGIGTRPGENGVDPITLEVRVTLAEIKFKEVSGSTKTK